MFKHVRIEATECKSCEQIKSNCVLVHVPGIATNILITICSECLETLLQACKPTFWANKGSYLWNNKNDPDIELVDFPGLDLQVGGKHFLERWPSNINYPDDNDN